MQLGLMFCISWNKHIFKWLLNICIWSIFIFNDSWSPLMWTWDIDTLSGVHQPQIKDNTSTPFFNRVKMSGWPQNSGQCSLYKPTSLQSRPSPRKGRENREKMRERERLTYRSGPQGKPDPAGILTCLISMSSTQPDKTISCSSLHFSFSLTFGLYINFRGQKNLLLIHI